MKNGDVITRTHPIYLCYTISIERFYDEYWLSVCLNTPNSNLIVEANTYKQDWWDRQEDPIETVFDYWIKYINDGNLW